MQPAWPNLTERQRQTEALQDYAAEQRSTPIVPGGKPRTKAEKKRLAARRLSASTNH